MDIQISAESYPKSPQLVDAEVFKRLRELFTDVVWLSDLEASFLELWNLCCDGQQQDLVIEPIHRFLYMTSRDLKHCGERIRDRVTTNWALDPARTAIIALAQGDKPDGSQALLQSIKDKFALINGWSEKNFVNKLTSGAYHLSSGDTAVLIDDFVGTGETANRKINWLLGTLKKRNVTECKIFMVFLAAMESARAILDSISLADYFSCYWLRRGISDEYNATDLVAKIQLMKDLEELLGAAFGGYELTKYSFGFKCSEALYSLEAHNIPNNVFPIFWWPVLKSGTRRNPMFRHFLG